MRPTVLLDLIDNLSPSAALWRAIDPNVLWGLPEMLTALLIDEVRALRWVFERANFKGHKPPPEPLPRPGVAGSETTDRDVIGAGEGFDTIAEFDAWYEQIRAEQRMPVPDLDDGVRSLPQRDSRGRFVRA